MPLATTLRSIVDAGEQLEVHVPEDGVSSPIMMTSLPEGSASIRMEAFPGGEHQLVWAHALGVTKVWRTGRGRAGGANALKTEILTRADWELS
jgi:hypothetical protein